CFFFSSRRRHTRSDRDWSSDVCSSDLELVVDVLVELRQAVLQVLDLPACPLLREARDQRAVLRPGRGDRNRRRVRVREDLQERRSEERRVGKECRAQWAGET